MDRQEEDFDVTGEIKKQDRNSSALTRKRNPARRSGRKFWLNLHLCLALSVGFVFVLLGLTGSFNVFLWELEEIGLPTPDVRKNVERRIDLDEVLAKIHERYPQRHGHWNLVMPGHGHDYLWAVYPKPEETAGELYAPHRLVIDPDSGKVVAESYWGRTVWTFIYEIHATLLTGMLGAEFGEIGFKTVSFLGLFLLISAASGIFLWWPRTGQFLKAMRFKRGASRSRFYFDLHRVAGVYGSIILIIIAFTGFSFGYGDYLKPAVEVFSPVQAEHFKDPEGLKSRWSPGAVPISIHAAVAVADRIFPDAELHSLVTPEGRKGFYTVVKRKDGEINRKGPRTKVWIDQYTGDVLASEDPERFSAGETFFNLMWPLHNGEFLGLASRILWCLTGFVPLILYVTGISLWLKKRRAHRIKREKSRAARQGWIIEGEGLPNALSVAEEVRDDRC